MVGFMNISVVGRLFWQNQIVHKQRRTLCAACALGALMRCAWRLFCDYARRLRAWCAGSTALDACFVTRCSSCL